MNLQEQIAQRRAERGSQEQAAIVEAKAVQARQRDVAVDSLAADLTSAGLNVHRQGESLAFTLPPPTPIDTAGLQKRKLQELLDKEARRRWTTADNWVVISSVAAGIALLHLGGLGIVPLAFGLWRGNALNNRYKAQVLEDHPELTAALETAPT